MPPNDASVLMRCHILTFNILQIAYNRLFNHIIYPETLSNIIMVDLLCTFSIKWSLKLSRFRGVQGGDELLMGEWIEDSNQHVQCISNINKLQIRYFLSHSRIILRKDCWSACWFCFLLDIHYKHANHATT